MEIDAMYSLMMVLPQIKSGTEKEWIGALTVTTSSYQSTHVKIIREGCLSAV